MTRWRRAAALVVTAVAVGACGGGGEDSSGSGAAKADDGKTVSLTVGLIPIIDVAPIYIGIEQGFFEKRNLEIEPQLAAGGAAIVPAVISGDNQIGFSNNVSLIIGKAKDLPIRVVAPGVGVSPDTTAGDNKDVGYCSVLAPKGGKVKDVDDLAGKSIAVNTLNNIGDVTIRAAIEQRGVDPRGVKFQEIPFPDMPPALDAGRVDAAWECEPFVTTLVADGARPILNNYATTDPNLTVASYFTSDRYATEHADVVRRFTEALKESMAYASDHPEAVRKAITEYTKIDAATAAKIGLPEFPTDFNRPSMQKLVDLSHKYGLIDEPLALDDLIAAP